MFVNPNSLRSYHIALGPAAGPTSSKILAPPLGAEHMERLLSPSTWGTAYAVADPGAENIGWHMGRGVPCPTQNFGKIPLVLTCAFCGVWPF